MKKISKQALMTASAIKRPMVISPRGTFKLERKTKSNSPNINGITYTKDAFDKAMREYVEKDGGLYLAPSSIDVDSYGEEVARKVNNNIYAKFHYPIPKREYLFAKVTRWNDNYIYFILNTTDVTGKYINRIISETKVALRYIADPSNGNPIESMKISLLDIGVIPFDELGIDIYEYIKGVS